MVAAIAVSFGVPDLRAEEPVTPLRGVWEGMRDFGPELRGPLTLVRNGKVWRATIGPFDMAVTVDGDLVSFDAPGDRGSFHGRVDPETGEILGQWIQPGAMSMFGLQFSTPVALVPTRAGRWSGMVSPMDDRIHVSFTFEPGTEGRLTAFLRNPELNFGRLFDFRDVRHDGDRVTFRGALIFDRDNEVTLLEGVWHESTDTLSVFIENLGGTFDLRQRNERSASYSLPRPWAGSRYDYRPPMERNDGWRTSDLESENMARAPIEELVRTIISNPIDAIDSPWFDAVLIARNGRLVLEEYFHGFHADRPHDVRSASKSITSTIVGAAIHRGDIELDSRVYDVMYGESRPEDLDPRAARMTLEHLITMTSGLDCDDWSAESPGSEDRMQNQSQQPDWNRYVLELPMRYEPGTHPAYCSGGMSLAGGVVSKSAGMPLTEYFERFVARPLDMTTYHTNLMPDGKAYAGGGLRITGRDFLKFGQLLLDDGVWNGRRLVDSGWSDAALKIRHDLGGERFGSYGYGWWLIDYELEGRVFKGFYAGGNGGNFIIGFPELELVIVFLGSNYNQAVMNVTKLDYVPRFILRSILEGREVD